MKSDTQSISIDASIEEVFGFLSNPGNLPKWATGFCKDIRQESSRWIAETPQGEMEVRYATNSNLSIIDFHMFPAPDVEGVAYSRILPNGEGSEYVFTQFQAPGMLDEVFQGQIESLKGELVLLKELMEK
jgi:uncharacterized membrane protein